MFKNNGVSAGDGDSFHKRRPGEGEKTVILSHLYTKTIFLPRQARDKRRENSITRPFFLRASSRARRRTRSLPRRGDSQNKNTQRAACDYQDTLRTRSGAKRLTDCLGISVLQGVKSVVTSNAAQDATGRAITVPNEQVRKRRLFCAVFWMLKMYHFTKPGSGQTQGKHSKEEWRFLTAHKRRDGPRYGAGHQTVATKPFRSPFSFWQKRGHTFGKTQRLPRQAVD